MSIYVFYLDVFLLHEILMNSAIICISLKFNKVNMEMKWIIISILFASLAPLVALKWSYGGYILCNYIIGIPVTSIIMAGRNWRRILSYGVTLTGFTFLIGGVAQAFENILRLQGRKQEYFELVLLISVILGAGITGIFQEKARQRRYVYQIVLRQGKKVYRGYGLYDSGNCLKYVKTREPVHIIDAGVLKELGIERVEGRIEYKSLGNSAGLIDLYRVERMTVRGKEIELVKENCLFGKAQDGLLRQRDYRIILNEEIGNEIM